jgi:hypothetical protein
LTRSDSAYFTVSHSLSRTENTTKPYGAPDRQPRASLVRGTLKAWIPIRPRWWTRA